MIVLEEEPVKTSSKAFQTGKVYVDLRYWLKMSSEFRNLPDDTDAFTDVELPLDPRVSTGVLSNRMRCVIMRRPIFCN